MLEDFDVSKLEELAESLLADVGADLEGADCAGRPADAEGGRPGQCLPGSVVGPAAALVEPGRPARPADSRSRLILTTHNYSKSPFYELSEEATEQPPAPSSNDVATPSSPAAETILANSDTLYGTYDNETNCITIVLTSDELQQQAPEPAEEQTVQEEVTESEEEMICEASEPQEDTLSSLGPIFIRPPSPLQDLLSPIGPAHHHNPLKSPGGFSSVSSDCGYESLGSPVSCASDRLSSYRSSGDSAALAEEDCAPSTTASTTPNEESDFSDSTSLSLDYALGDFDDIWNLDLFPILS